MTYAIIIAIIVIILAILFLRKHDDSKSDYKEPEFKHSGRKWVFNGILDIDNPPQEKDIFTQYPQRMELMVKKGFLHYSINVNSGIDEKFLGLWRAEATIDSQQHIVISVDGTNVATLPDGQNALAKAIRENNGKCEAYIFIAKLDDSIYGEACVKK